jgi:hypothetical protein
MNEGRQNTSGLLAVEMRFLKGIQGNAKGGRGEEMKRRTDRI